MEKMVKKTVKKIVFRCDANAHIGMGHLSRMLTLAGYIAPFYEIHFACYATNLMAINEDFITHRLATNTTDELVALLKKLSADALIIDHYGIDETMQKAIKHSTDVKLISFDDDYKKHFCDVLINPNAYADKSLYALEHTPIFLMGREWILMKPNLIKSNSRHREKSPFNPRTLRTIKDLKRYEVLSIMGGSDAKNMNPLIISHLSKYVRHLHIATTSYNPKRLQLKAHSRRFRNVSVHINKELSTLIARSDIGIVTPSVSAYEALYAKLFFVAVEVADNQRFISDYLHRMGIPVIKQPKGYQLKGALQRLIKNRYNITLNLKAIHGLDNGKNYQEFFKNYLLTKEP